MSTPSQDIVTASYNRILDSLRKRNLDIVVSHQGELSKDEVNTIAYDVERKLKEEGTKKGPVKRIFSIIIEALQNIRLHGERDSENVQVSYVILGKSEDEFVLAQANLVTDSVREKIEVRLENINSLERPALKEYYMETLTDGEISSKGGAGLGFITIAMKSKNKIKYEFNQADTDMNLFTMMSTIKLK